MEKLQYIKDFESLGMGLFVHFGLYSMVGKGEWYLHLDSKADPKKYEKLAERFNPSKNWAKNLVKTAKSAGAKYITITTRHHDGFSLYDACGLSDYDSMHAACRRDLIREFVDACREGGIVPFFYHTLLDWRHPDYNTDFPAYLEYLRESVAILCKNYGKIGGLWFDGMWDKPNADWELDALYATIRRYQPEAMIINNSGMGALGAVCHPEVDSVTFERGKPAAFESTDKLRAGEMCQILNDHWGYAKDDVNYKPLASIIEDLVDCRRFNCNFLLNIGPMGNGSVRPIDACMLAEVGKWIKANKSFIYGVHSSDVTAENADMLTDGTYYYAAIRTAVEGDPNVVKNGESSHITINAPVKKACWLDSGERIKVKNNSFEAKPFEYGKSLAVRIARIELK